MSSYLSAAIGSTLLPKVLFAKLAKAVLIPDAVGLSLLRKCISRNTFRPVDKVLSKSTSASNEALATISSGTPKIPFKKIITNFLSIENNIKNNILQNLSPNKGHLIITLVK